MSRVVIALLAGAVFFSSSCAGDGGGKRDEVVKQVMVETDRPTDVSSLSRKVFVHVTDEGCVLELGGSRIVCSGHGAYAGRVGSSSGWLRVGALDLSYDRRNLRVRSKSRITNLALTESLNVIVDQSGAVARSIFTE